MPDSEAVCTCGKRIGFKRDDSMGDVPWWVCANCGKPTRLYLERAFTNATAVEVDD